MEPYYKIDNKKIQYKKNSLTKIFKRHGLKNLSKLRVLDIGSGSGLVTISSAMIAKQGCVYGIEPSESMLKDARNNKKIFIPKLDNIKFFKGNGIDLHFKTKNQFDVILYMNSLHFMKEEDRIESLKLSNNLLKKNGVIIFSFPIWDKEYNEKDNILIKSCIKLLKNFASINKYKFLNKNVVSPKKNNKTGYFFGVIKKTN
jgi:SAM-dependent methyltransferase